MCICLWYDFAYILYPTREVLLDMLLFLVRITANIEEQNPLLKLSVVADIEELILFHCLLCTPAS